MARSYRDFLDDRQPIEIQDWDEFAAYLDGGVEGVAAFEFAQANLELTQVGNIVSLVYSEIQALILLGEPTEIFIREHQEDILFVMGG